MQVLLILEMIQRIHPIKTVGKVAALKELVKQESDCSSHCGIGHTAGQTHGGVTTENAHPHRQGLVTRSIMVLLKIIISLQKNMI